MRRITITVAIILVVTFTYQFIPPSQPAFGAVSTITVELTKQWPTLLDNGLLNVPVQCVLKDNDVTVKTFTVTLITSRANTNVDNSAPSLIAQVQAEVDRYKAERTLYNHQKFDDLVTTIGASLSL